MNLLKCMIYLAVTGGLSFLLGRMIPKRMLKEDQFPYKTFAFEKDGKLYERIRIKEWQGKVPDMSRILPGVMPAKKLDGNYRENLPVMIKETCVAEAIHILLCFSGIYCVKIWPGIGGGMIAILYAMGNIPFILIQRYNRPRLKRLLRISGKRGL